MTTSLHPRIDASEPQRSEPQKTAPATTRTLPVGWALFAGLVGPAVTAVCIGLEPAPANPNAPEPLIATLLGFALLIAWAGAAFTAVQRRPAALTWASVVGGLSMAMTISCPLSGHHTSIGMWWIGEFLVCGAAWAAAVVGTYSIKRG